MVVEKNLIKKFTLLKILLVLNHIYSLLCECDKSQPILKNNICVSTYCTEEQFKSGECVINEEITKTQWLTNIIKFEKTNGYISLTFEDKSQQNLLFLTISSNNKDQKYLVMDSLNFEYNILNLTDNNEIITPQLYPLILSQKNYFILIGIENSNIIVIDETREIEDYLTLNSSYFLNYTNKVIKGIESLCFFYNEEHFIYATITQKSDDLTDYYLTFFDHIIENKLNMNNDFYFKLNYIKDIDLTKGNFVSCSIIDETDGHVTCFYLSSDNSYTITVVQNTNTDFIIQSKNIIGSPSNLNENNLYFLKVISIDDYKVIYSYFSGDEDNIPTFLIREISTSDFSLSNLYSDFPSIYLYDYEFNNNIKYNDLAIVGTKQFFFISTNDNKDTLIIANIYIYIISTTTYKLIIRYYTIKLKEYYYLQILNGFKAVYLRTDYLALAFDFCNYDLCSNSNTENNNAGLIFFSYINYNNQQRVDFDFIEYAFKYNRNYILVNFTENITIENNIFGYSFTEVSVSYYEYNENIMKFYKEEDLLDLDEDDSYYLNPEDKIKAEVIDYSLKTNNYFLDFILSIDEPSEINEYNQYCDKINDTLGDQSDNQSFLSKNKYSLYISYYFTISQNLSTICSNPNCTLCLEADRDYCLVCENDSYEVLYGDYKFGKLKICINPETESTIPISSEETQQITDISKTSSELSFKDIIEDKYKDVALSDDQLDKLYNDIKDYINNDYNGENTIINKGNTKIQISTLDSQLDSELSNVDLRECAEILKEKYSKTNNDSLIILKFDIKPENEKSTYVQYEIYDKNSNQFLSLEECEGMNVIINSPIDIDSYIESLYETMSKSGYNLFDANDSFYNDICAVYTTQNGTDILLYDRRMDIYQSTINISLCQEGCIFLSYNSETKKAECNCPIQKEKIQTNTSKMEFEKNGIIEEFRSILRDSNFKVMKCYKLIFNPKVFIKNIGSIVMTIALVIFLSLIIFYFAKSSKIISFYIQSIIKLRVLDNNANKNISNNNANNDINKNNDKIIDNNIDSKNNNLGNSDVQNVGNIDNIDINKKSKKVLKQKRSKIITTVIKKKKKVPKKSMLPILPFNNINNNNIKLNTDYKNAPPKKNQNKTEDFLLEADNKNLNNKINDKNKFFQFNKGSGDNSIDNNKYIKNKMNNKNNIFNFNQGSNISNENNKNEIININHEIPNVEINNQQKENTRLEDKNIKIFAYKNKSSIKEKGKIKKKTKGHSNSVIGRSVNFIENIKEKNGIDSNNIKPFIEKINTDNLNINNEVEKFNDQEMNTLEYEKALILDKRNYFQYYYSLLKKKQLILFTFFPTNDYNIMALKISLFIVSACLYFTIDAFFFSDETMHKIYKDNGAFNILYRIPQIIYSSIIPSIINMILKTLSLSEKDLLKIKQEKDIKDLVNKAKKIERCIYIKFIIFFLISLMLMLFFWYFISCFCAVYNNTQMILIKDSLISFGISMLYPFGLNLIPGFFRIPALRAEKKDKKCLYKISQYIALI